MDSKPDEIYEKEQDTKYTNYSCRDKSCPVIPEILLCSPDGIVCRKAGIVDPGQETAIIIICGGSEKAYPFGNRMTCIIGNIQICKTVLCIFLVCSSVIDIELNIWFLVGKTGNSGQVGRICCICICINFFGGVIGIGITNVGFIAAVLI